jgi:hypothetical protein
MRIGTNSRHSGAAHDTTTASCASVRQDSATVEHCFSRSRGSIAARGPPSSPIDLPAKAATALSSAVVS